MSKRKTSTDSAVRGRTAQVPTDHMCPHCGGQLGAELHHETWIEVPIEGGWILAYRLVQEGDTLVVAEVRAFPDEQAEPSEDRLVELKREDESPGEVSLILPQHRARPPGSSPRPTRR